MQQGEVLPKAVRDAMELQNPTRNRSDSRAKKQNQRHLNSSVRLQRSNIESPTSNVLSSVTYAHERFHSLDPSILRVLESHGARQTNISGASLVSLSAATNKSFLEYPYTSCPLRLDPKTTIFYLSGEQFLKDRFLCARYVTTGSPFQPRIISHTGYKIQGSFVERPLFGPVDKGSRVLRNPDYWYSPGRVLQRLPDDPLLHDHKFVIASTCVLVKGNGEVFMSTDGHALLVDPRKIAAFPPEQCTLNEVHVSLGSLQTALIDVLNRFFSRPFGSQPLQGRQARIFRMDAWLNNDKTVFGVELHTKGFDGVNAGRQSRNSQSVLDMLSVLSTRSSSNRFKIADIEVISPEEAENDIEDVEQRVTQSMTTGDETDTLSLKTVTAAHVHEGKPCTPESQRVRETLRRSRQSNERQPVTNKHQKDQPTSKIVQDIGFELSDDE